MVRSNLTHNNSSRLYLFGSFKNTFLLPLASTASREKGITQFGRIVEELGIEMFAASSPQAKGRIERLWETLQSRFVASFLHILFFFFCDVVLSYDVS